METKLIQRLVGVVVIAAAAVIIIPALFKGTNPNGQQSVTITEQAPPAPTKPTAQAFAQENHASVAATGLTDSNTNDATAQNVSSNNPANPQATPAQSQPTVAQNTQPQPAATLNTQSTPATTAQAAQPVAPTTTAQIPQPDYPPPTQQASAPVAAQTAPVVAAKNQNPSVFNNSAAAPVHSSPLVSTSDMPSSQGQASTNMNRPLPAKEVASANKLSSVEQNAMDNSQPVAEIAPKTKLAKTKTVTAKATTTLTHKNKMAANKSGSEKIIATTKAAPKVAASQTKHATSQANVAALEAQSLAAETATTNTTATTAVSKPIASAVDGKAWVVQLGSFASVANAKTLEQQLQAHGFTAYLQKAKTSHGVLTKVLIGPETQKAKALKILTQLNQQLKLKGVIAAYVP